MDQYNGNCGLCVGSSYQPSMWFKIYIIRETGIQFLIKTPCLMWLVNKQKEQKSLIKIPNIKYGSSLRYGCGPGRTILTSKFRLKDSPPPPAKIIKLLCHNTKYSPNAQGLPSAAHRQQSTSLSFIIRSHSKDVPCLSLREGRAGIALKPSELFSPPKIKVASVIMHLPPFNFSPRTRLQKLQNRDVKFKLQEAKGGK